MSNGGCFPSFCGGGNGAMCAGLQSKSDSIPTKDETERMLAEAMTRLSVEEREEALERIHGVSAAPASANDITPQQVAAMAQIKMYMAKHATKAYNAAMAQDPTYLAKENLLLSFLNSTESRNPDDAARRLLDYLDYKLWLFGSEALCREIKLSDLTEDDLRCVVSGSFQCMGRPITMSLPWINVSVTLKTWLRCFMFGTLFSGPEQDPSRCECVGVIYSSEKPEPPKYDVSWPYHISKLARSLPVKSVSTHLVMHPSTGGIERRLVYGFLSSMPLIDKARTHIHVGSDMFIHYELRRFGIDTDSPRFPVDLNGDFKPLSAQLYLEAMKRKEQEPRSSASAMDQSIVVPTDNDVLLGHGMECRYHPGNEMFRKIVKSFYPAYDSASRSDKPSIVQQVIAQCENNHGTRFLKFDADTNSWMEETDKKVIAKKVGAAFRVVRRNLKQQSALS